MCVPVIDSTPITTLLSVVRRLYFLRFTIESGDQVVVLVKIKVL